MCEFALKPLIQSEAVCGSWAAPAGSHKGTQEDFGLLITACVPTVYVPLMKSRSGDAALLGDAAKSPSPEKSRKENYEYVLH